MAHESWTQLLNQPSPHKDSPTKKKPIKPRDDLTATSIHNPLHPIASNHYILTLSLSRNGSLSLCTSTFLRPPPLLSARKLCKPPQRWIITSRKKAEEPSADKSIHPPFYEDARVFCNGEHVLTVAGTQKEYVVDVWSGNHPFYLGSRSQTLVDDDQVSKFRKRFGSITQFMEIPVLKGEIVIPPRRKRIGKDGKKK